MRTTVTIEDALLREAKVVAAKTHSSVSSVLEEALRAHLVRARVSVAEPFELPKFSGGGLLIDILDKEALADALGDNDPIP